MLRRYIIIYGLLILYLSIYSNQVYALIGTEHVSSWGDIKNTSKIFGGLGGKFTDNDLKELQHLIDQWGDSGGDHRNNGSHDFKTFKKELKKHIKVKGWNKKALKNAIAIHNIGDMSAEGSKGTNGWNKNPKRKLQAKALMEKIEKGERILKFPKWATKAGPDMRVTDNYRKFCAAIVKNGAVIKPVKTPNSFSKLFHRINPSEKIKNVFGKFKVVVDKCPKSITKNAGTYIYVIYEGTTLITRIVKGTDLEAEILNAVSTSFGILCAAGGMKAGLIVCIPLEAVPGAGPFLHWGGAISISIGSGIAGDYVASQFIDYVVIQYI